MQQRPQHKRFCHGQRQPHAVLSLKILLIASVEYDLGRSMATKKDELTRCIQSRNTRKILTSTKSAVPDEL